VNENVKWRSLETSPDFIVAVTAFTKKVFEHEASRRQEVGSSIFYLYEAGEVIQKQLETYQTYQTLVPFQAFYVFRDFLGLGLYKNGNTKVVSVANACNVVNG
jgi:hypothetical protein